ncbi:DUF2318 domain-containing protein [Affinibrenneria salicis]|uniref:DUF2318 domain-containing protein n=1 Tax=Affinibrenneria salicis TaxID=2590031 RepID=A0A5J5G1F8_9GAMM|nr:Fe-S-containing protein [Affinibrenneria salicis]KAA9000478.1 DUF2318 domain-containing protein [Affinibrenneria salicis]
MSYFFVTTLQAFLPIALLCGLNWVRRSEPGIRPLAWITLLALVAGTLFGAHLPKGQQSQLILIVIQLAALLLFLLSQLLSSPRVGYLWQALLTAGAALHWASDPNLGALTATHVVNTELLLNFSAVAVAFGWIAFCAVLCAMMTRRLARLRWPLLLALVALLALPLSGNLLLLLMKLQAIGLTKPRLSYVAHVTNSAPWLAYLSALLLAVLLACYLRPLLRLRRSIAGVPGATEKRKATAGYRNARRTVLATALAALVIVLGQLYWDQVASQPPRLSEALPVSVAADGLVHIPIEQVRDGKLHRFVWVADDGKAVRFFVINRYPDRLRLGVVFDACLLCGDQGYVMEGNQVICVACGVHIFIPSIGKAGGCNPVPIEGWRNDEKELTIAKADLATGVNYFSTIVTLQVIDPVDGSHLTNVKAEHKYSYGGKLWFFSSEANYNRFRDNPTQFVPAGSVQPDDATEEQ